MQYQGFGKRTTQTPQNIPIPGREAEMTPNHAGGYGFSVDDVTRLRRFLILGGVGGSYYVGEHKLIGENLEVVERLLRMGKGREVVDCIVEISVAGRAPSNDPALFALARCCACDVHGKQVQQIPEEKRYTLHREHHPALFEKIPDGGSLVATKEGKPGQLRTFTREGETITLTYQRMTRAIQVDHPDDIAIRQYAFSVLPKVVRTGTHLFHFQGYIKQFRGRGRSLRRAIRAWFQEKPLEKLAYQVLKYQSRDGWTQRDILRLARPNPLSAPGNTKEYSPRNHLYQWVVKGWKEEEAHVALPSELSIIAGYERLKRASDPREAARVIAEYHLPRETVPTQFLTAVPVWEALLQDMPLEALIRNLATMTRNGTLETMNTFTQSVVTRLSDRDAIKRARLHPVKILAALTTYSSGHGVRSERTWTPLREIVDILDQAFYLSFDQVEPTDKRLLIGIDVSYSMYGTRINGIAGMDCHTAAAAQAMVLAKSAWKETVGGIRIPTYSVLAFDTAPYPLTISPGQRLDDVRNAILSVGRGGTDCSIPMQWALQKKIPVDVFVLLSDSESWAGRAHPTQVLEEYRARINPDARIINIAMTATKVTTNDPRDMRALEIAGFDTAVPELVTSFIKGEI